MAYHSALLEPGLPKLRQEIDRILNCEKGEGPANGGAACSGRKNFESRRRTGRWISTCYDDAEIKRDKNHAGNFLSGEYHCHNFRNPVEFFQAVKGHVPDGALIVEVGPSGLFRGSIKKIASFTQRKFDYVSLMSRDKNSLEIFEKGYGSLFVQGAVPNLVLEHRMHPRQNLFVRDDIALRQLFVSWDHSVEYPMPILKDMMTRTGAPGEEEMLAAGGGGDWMNMHNVEFDFSPEGPDHFLMDHVIDEAALLPACAYLSAAWEGFAAVVGKHRKAKEESNSSTRGEDLVDPVVDML